MPMSETTALLTDLKNRIDQLVVAARQEGRDQALGEIRALVGGGVSVDPVRRGPGRPRGSKNAPKATDGRKNSWSNLTPEARLARVNSIRRAKGLPPRSA